MVCIALQQFCVQVYDVVAWARTELALFLLAFVLHWMLFGTALPGRLKRAGSKRKPSRRASSKILQKGRTSMSSSSGSDEDAFDGESCGRAASKPDAQDAAQALRQCEAACAKGDYRGVLRHWRSAKYSNKVSEVLLVAVVEAMQRFQKSGTTILAEVQDYIRRNPALCDAAYVQRLLEPLVKSLDNAVVMGMVEFLPSVGIEMDENLQEILLKMQLSLRNFEEVMGLGEQIRKKGLTPTPRMSLILLKAALQLGRFEEALCCYLEVAASSDVTTTMSAAPRHLAARLVELACQRHSAQAVLVHLEAGRMPVTSEILNTLFAEYARNKDVSLVERTVALCKTSNVELNSRTYCHLLKNASGSPQRCCELLDEMAKQRIDFSQEVVNTVLALRGQNGLRVADGLLSLVLAQPSVQAAPLLALIRFHVDLGQPEKSCDIFEHYSKTLSDDSGRYVLDGRTERALLSAAAQCGRHSLIEGLAKDAPKDTAKYIQIIRGCASRGRLDEAWNIFSVLEKAGADMTRSLHNALLDACVECNDFASVQKLMKQMEDAGNTDAVSYNTLMKGYLRKDSFTRAWAVMDDMRRAGHQPNHVTFNELIHALVHSASDRQREKVWKVIDEMKTCGVQPNRITCSILLKCLTVRSSGTDIQHVMELLDNMSEPMDEVLLSSTVEACVRIGTPALVAEKLAKYQGDNAIPVNGAHTFGSLIKAYGVAKDIDGAWRCWRKMRLQHVRPTSITIGCMVEAVVTNGDVDGGYDLILQLLDDADCKDQVNAVIFGSVLKGYNRARRTERVFAVFEDMLSRGIEPSVITYNAVLDACARNGRMDAVPKFLQDMKSRALSPNLITYSTIIKGFCQKGDMAAALGALADLRQNKDLKPDEIVYNTLLEGCAQVGLATEAERLWADMAKQGVMPSSYTLTVMVKVMGQARQIERAFELVEVEGPRRLRVSKVGPQVYNMLLQVCLSTNRDTARATETFNRMVALHMRPDPRVCQTLVRKLLANNPSANAQQVATILRYIAQETQASQQSSSNGHSRGGQRRQNTCGSSDSSTVQDKFFEEAIRRLAESPAPAPALTPTLMSDILVARPKMHIDASLQNRVMSTGR